MVILRDYQEAAVNNVITDWQHGFKRVLLMSATGTGKTVMLLEVIDRAMKDQNFTRALIVAHTEELIYQPQERAMIMYPHMGLKMGTVMGATDIPYAQIVVATIQTLSAGDRLSRILEYGDFSHIIIDEAHHATATTYQELLERQPDAFVLGVTATPKRTDGTALGLVFTKVSFRYSIQDAIRDGVLSPFTPMGFSLPVTVPDGDDLGGDGENRKVGKLLSAENILEIFFDKWQQYGENRPTIGFAASVAQARAMADYFSAMGVMAASVDGTTKKAQRRQLLEEYKGGAMNVLFTCRVLTEGFDAPNTSCLMMAAPTSSDLVYTQRLGRGLRPSPGKSDCRVLDFAPASARNLVFSGDVLDGVPKRVQEQAERAEQQGVLFTMAVNRMGEVGFIDPMDITPQVLNYLGKTPLAWTFDGLAATATVSDTVSLCILTPDRERIERADQVRRERNGLNPASQRVLDFISRYRIYVISKETGGRKRSFPKLQKVVESFTDAKTFCETGFSPDGLGDKKRAWRNQPASPAQVQLLQRMGEQELDGMTKGQAAQRITHMLTLQHVKPLDMETERAIAKGGTYEANSN